MKYSFLLIFVFTFLSYHLFSQRIGTSELALLNTDSSTLMMNNGYNISLGTFEQYKLSSGRILQMTNQTISEEKLLSFDSLYSTNANIEVVQYELDLGCVPSAGGMMILKLNGRKLSDKYKSVIKKRKQVYFTIGYIVLRDVKNNTLYKSYIDKYNFKVLR